MVYRKACRNNEPVETVSFNKTIPGCSLHATHNSQFSIGCLRLNRDFYPVGPWCRELPTHVSAAFVHVIWLGPCCQGRDLAAYVCLSCFRPSQQIWFITFKPGLAVMGMGSNCQLMCSLVISVQVSWLCQLIWSMSSDLAIVSIYYRVYAG